METKKWYKSKAIWAGIITVVVTAYNAAIPEVAAQFQVVLPDIPAYVYALLGILGVYGRKSATTEIK